MKILFVLAALICMLSAAQSDKGVKIAISEAALEYIKTVMLPDIEKLILTTSIPDISGSVSTPIGDIDYTLSSITINQFQVLNSDIQLRTPHNLAVTVSSVALACHLNWHYRTSIWPHISDSGSADVTASGVSAFVDAVYGIDSTGRPTAAVDTCTVSISSLNIDLHGGASWLYGLFVDIFSGQIKSSIINALQNDVPPQINQMLAQLFSTMALVKVIMPDIEIDYTLEEAPFVSNNMLLASAKGELYAIDHHQENPGEPVDMPDSITSQMFQVMISEWSANSVGFAFTLANYMMLTLTRDNSSSQMANLFNSSTLGQGLPNLQLYYPNALLEFNVYAQDPPQTNFAAEDPQLTVTVGGVVTVFAQNAATGNFDDAFSLAIKLLLGGNVAIDPIEVKITAVLEVITSSMTLLSTNIGPIDVDNLNDLLDFIALSSLDQINAILAQGFALPTIDGITLSNPSVTIGDQYLAVSSDIVYKP